ncbi:hypothetical protein [Aequorivita sp. CIP111184]|uniref:hypothetical protein n=1 Tax=Aequorivita sp. CIP111184 TaxID=2211356 RepID=UPI000DBBC6B8|nr:hypothetical protein [Aequorivita sp. CIP111184]SRX53867.1 hypothetical protein AEQU1_00929 [Aequorivita sp. CIP111184]
MRYFALTLSLFLLIGISCQNKKNREAPEKIKEAFFKLHPNATITKWNDEPPIWEAKYKDSNEKGAVSLDPNGKVTETELVIKENQLANPKIIQEYIKTHYSGEIPDHFEKDAKPDGAIT